MVKQLIDKKISNTSILKCGSIICADVSVKKLS